MFLSIQYFFTLRVSMLRTKCLNIHLRLPQRSLGTSSHASTPILETYRLATDHGTEYRWIDRNLSIYIFTPDSYYYYTFIIILTKFSF